MHIKVKDLIKTVDSAMAEGHQRNNNETAIHIAIVMLPGAGRHLINSMRVFSKHGYQKIVTDITRPLEENEHDGKDYHARLGEVFESYPIIEETAYRVGHYRYGLNSSEFLPLVAAGKKCLFSTSADGTAALKELFGNNIVTVYVKVSEGYWLSSLEEKFKDYPNKLQKTSPRKIFGRKELEKLGNKNFVKHNIDLVIDADDLDPQTIAYEICEKVEKLKSERFQQAS